MRAAPDDGWLTQFVQLARQQDQPCQQREKCQHDRQLQTQDNATCHDSSRSRCLPSVMPAQDRTVPLACRYEIDVEQDESLARKFLRLQSS
jgi:hypothetical protein